MTTHDPLPLARHFDGRCPAAQTSRAVGLLVCARKTRGVAALVVAVVLLGATLSGCASGGATAASPVSPPPPAGHGHTVAGATTAAGRLVKFSRRPVSAGRLLLTTLTGPASSVRMRVWVWLPPQYDNPAYARVRFPVLTLFPGGDGVAYTAFFDPQKIGIVVEGAASGRLSPFIIVEPQLQPSIRLDTECTDLAGQPRVGTFMEQDVPAMVRANFRVARTPSGWGVGGVSSGAYCASRLLFARPDVWSTGASLGGYFKIDTPLRAGHTPAARATSPQVVAATRAPAVLLRAWVGGTSSYAVYLNRSFMKVVRPPTRVELRIVPGGDHTWRTFQKLLPEMFAFFTAHLDRPSKS